MTTTPNFGYDYYLNQSNSNINTFNLPIVYNSITKTIGMNSASSAKSGYITTTSQTIGGAKTLSNTTASTSTSTGALIVSGGMGLAENLYVGGSISADNLRTVESYGAVGDGITNDTAAINLALASGENIIFGFQKTYYCSGILLMPTTGSRLIDFNNSIVANDNSLIMSITDQTSDLMYIIKNGSFIQTKTTVGCVNITDCAGKLYFENMRFIGPVSGSGYGSATVIHKQCAGGSDYYNNCTFTAAILAYRDIVNGVQQNDLTQWTNCIFDCSGSGVGAITTEGTTSKHHVISNCYFKCLDSAQYAIYAYMPDLLCTGTVFDWNNTTDINSCKCCGADTSPTVYNFINCYFLCGLWATCPNTNNSSAPELFVIVNAIGCDLLRCRMTCYTASAPPTVKMYVSDCKGTRLYKVDIYVGGGSFNSNSLFEISNSALTQPLEIINSGTVYGAKVIVRNNIFSAIDADGSLYIHDFVDGTITIKDNIFNAGADASMPYLIKTEHRPTISGTIASTFSMQIDNNLITDPSRILHGLKSHWGKTVDNVTITNNKGSGKLYYCLSNTTAPTVSNSYCFNNVTYHTNNTHNEIIGMNGSLLQMRGYDNVNYIPSSNEPAHISKINITRTHDSTSTSTGSLICAGGMGLGGNLNMAGSLSVSDGTDSSSTSTGAFICEGGVGIEKALNVGGLLNVGGAFACSNGGGVGTDLYVGCSLNVLGTSDSSSTSTGSLVCEGGVGIEKSLNVGSDMYIGGTFGIAPVQNNITLIDSAFSNAANTAVFTVFDSVLPAYTFATSQVLYLRAEIPHGVSSSSPNASFHIHYFMNNDSTAISNCTVQFKATTKILSAGDNVLTKTPINMTSVDTYTELLTSGIMGYMSFTGDNLTLDPSDIITIKLERITTTIDDPRSAVIVAANVHCEFDRIGLSSGY